MTKGYACWRHPAHPVVGVCAACLRERLTELATENERYFSPQRCSWDSNASSMTEVDEFGNPVTIATLMEADQVEAEYRSRLAEQHPDPVSSSRVDGGNFQRNKSWSQLQTNVDPNVTSLAKMLGGPFLYGEHSLPSAVEPVLAKSSKFSDMKGHNKASSWPVIEQHKQQQRGSSWLSSFFHFRRRKPQEVKSGNESNKTSRLGSMLWKKKRSTAAGAGAGASAFEDSSTSRTCSPWQQGQSMVSEKTNCSTQDQQGRLTKKVMPYGDVDQEDSERKLSEKLSALNAWTSFPKRSSNVSSETWSKTFGTPLRMFSKHQQKSSSSCSNNNTKKMMNSSKSKDELDIPYNHDEKKLWHNPSYTAYYRDYGAWSLHSSPMPGKGKRHNTYKNVTGPQGGGAGTGTGTGVGTSRDMFHSGASPYNGSNTWNFYLTPLRPLRSRHHRGGGGGL